MAIIIFDLDQLNHSLESKNLVSYGYDRALVFRDVYDGIVGTTRVMHGFVKNFRGTHLQKMNAYIGRSSQDNVLGRFLAHAREKNLSYGAIVGVVPTSEIEGVEGLIIKLLSKLKSSESLCVGDIVNKANGSFGPLPSDDESVIYVCFSFDDNGSYHGLPTPTELDEMARELVDEIYTDIEIKPRKLSDAIKIVRQRSSIIASRFHPDHQ